MLKKTITFKDLDGNEVTEDFYFNLNKAEIAEMELSYEGGLSDYLQVIIKKTDGGAIITAFKDIVTRSVGRRSEDGRRFIKSPDITNEFLQTEAYSEMFMELVTSAEAAAKFIEGIVPEDMRDAVGKIDDVPLPDEDSPAWVRENREPTKKELATMTPEQLREAFAAREKRSGG